LITENKLRFSDSLIHIICHLETLVLNASVTYIPFAIKLFLISEFTYKFSVILEHEEAYRMRKV